MKLGVVADIHGNDVALRAVLADASGLGVDRWWALGDPDLVERYAAMAAGIAWTRGVLDQAGLLDVLIALPPQLRLPSGPDVLGVHASPHADSGPGIDPGIADEQLGPLLDGCGADVVIGGHTHTATDRLVGSIRALNPGSAGLPHTPGTATWLLLDDGGDELAVTHRSVPFDAEAVAGDLHRRRHPNADFVTAMLTGRQQR